MLIHLATQLEMCHREFKKKEAREENMVAPQHKTSSPERIRIAAKDLFATKGFHQTSMAELAAAADMSVGLIYRSFKSKGEIIEAIVRADFEEKIAELDELRGRLESGKLTVLETFTELFLQVIDTKEEALSFDIIAEGYRNDRVGQTIGEMCGQFRDYLGKFARAANPTLQGDDLAGATELLLGCLFGLGHRSISAPRLDAVRTAESSARMIVAALKDG
ncbi:helix-turn-helix domain-containing protein [Novosphingobium sp. BL-8H]|uniref:TetR/AcrR family transcriptional regulator n=1 Tax=Novosphingobium sp. BL-8H TaxID=3127640 RepID=UPI003757752D